MHLNWLTPDVHPGAGGGSVIGNDSTGNAAALKSKPGGSETASVEGFEIVKKEWP